MSVLLIDDDDDFRTLTRVLLDATGLFNVTAEAADGEEGIAAAETAQPDLVLLDLEMPRIGGLDALPQLRRVAPHAKIVVLSGMPRMRMEPPTRAAGAVAYLEKEGSTTAFVDQVVALTGTLEALEAAMPSVGTSLPSEPGAAGLSRRFVDEALRRLGNPTLLDDVRLLVSELVSNAVMHAQSNVDVSVILGGDVLRVEVHDRSDAIPVPRDASPEDPSGRGLAIVAAVASRWGVFETDGGKVVWFELHC